MPRSRLLQLARLVGGVACAGHILGNFAGARCYLLYASRDLPRCRTLLLDGSGDGGGHAADLADGVADAADRNHAVTGRGLDSGDLFGDLFGGLAVWVASPLTSDATTAKPRPASPARAASMVAFSASRLVWLAIAPIRRSTSPIFSAVTARLPTISVVCPAFVTAVSAMSLERVT